MISADRGANNAASRRGALPRSVPARTMPAHTMPMQISLARVIASMKTSRPGRRSRRACRWRRSRPYSRPAPPRRTRSCAAPWRPKAQAAPHRARPRETRRDPAESTRSARRSPRRRPRCRSCGTSPCAARRRAAAGTRCAAEVPAQNGIVELEPERDVKGEADGSPKPQAKQQRRPRRSQRMASPPGVKNACRSLLAAQPRSGLYHGSNLTDHIAAERDAVTMR